MAFSLNGNSLPTIHSYERALAEWEKRPGYRNGKRVETTGRIVPDDERPLSPYKHKTHLRIRKDRNDDIALVYHDTDVVTYHPNGDITVEGWPSMSTNVFIRETTPNDVMRFDVNDAQFGFVAMLRNGECKDRYWPAEMTCHRFESSITLTPDGGFYRPSSSTLPFEVPHLDRKRANRALKDYRFHEFRDWYHLRMQLVKGNEPDETHYDPEPEEIAAMLADASRWEELAGCTFEDLRSEHGWGRRERDERPSTMRRLFVENIRQRVLRHAGALTIETRPSVSYGELKRLRDNLRKFRWLFQ